MKTFIYDFNGVWLGGFMYIRAEDRKEADEMFKKGLPKFLYDKNVHSNGRVINDNITVTEIKKGKRTHLIWDGDY
jgi:hypothetical protein